MIIVYGICIVAAIILCTWYFQVDVRRSIVQNMMLLVLAVANVGYFMSALANDYTGVLISKKIIYLGACFLPLLFFFSICEMCHIKIKRHAVMILSLIQLFEFAMVCTIGYTGWFYKSVEYVNTTEGGMLLKEYGPLHILHPITIYGYFLASIIVGIYTISVKKNVEKRSLVIMISCLGLTSVSYLVQNVFELKYDYTPIIYIIMLLGIIVPLYISDLYDLVENEDVIREQLGGVGFVAFDEKLGYRGCNEYAKRIIGELGIYEIGKPISCPPDELLPSLKEVELFLEERKSIKSHCCVEGSNLKLRDQTFQVRIHSLMNHLMRCVGAIMEIRDITDHTNMLELKQQYNEQLESEVWEKTERIREIQQRTILGMAQMVESRDLSTGGHIKRTSEVVRIFAKKLLESDMGFDKNFLTLVTRSAPMHDLGKIGVDDAVLRKQGKFTDEEYEKMKKHSEIGGKIVMDVLSGVEDKEFVKVAFNVANYHHEKVNGKGYPVGLVGEEIPIEARIMALADVFDALVSKRCYKDAFSYDRAFSIIEEDAGAHFDAKLAKLFLECRSELEAYYDEESDK